MKRTLLILSVILICSSTVSGQPITFSKKIHIDTLRIFLDLSDEIYTEMQSQIRLNFIHAIEDFNTQDGSYFVLVDSSKKSNWLHINVGNIHYVSTKESIIWTGINLIFIAGHVYMISSYGWTLPILLFPSTHSMNTIEATDGLITRPNKPYLAVGPGGMYRSIEKQNSRYLKKFKKKAKKLLVKIDKQNKRNNVA